jgi:hypothetical protein
MRPSKGELFMQRQRNTPLAILTVKLLISPRKNREAFRKAADVVYHRGRRTTQDGGGRGPWIFLAYEDAPTVKSLRMKRALGVRLDEDLWIELAFYPNRANMMKIVRQLRHDKEFKTTTRELARLAAPRIHGYQGTMVLALLQQI